MEVQADTATGNRKLVSRTQSSPLTASASAAEAGLGLVPHLSVGRSRSDGDYEEVEWKLQETVSDKGNQKHTIVGRSRSAGQYEEIDLDQLQGYTDSAKPGSGLEDKASATKTSATASATTETSTKSAEANPANTNVIVETTNVLPSSRSTASSRRRGHYEDIDLDQPFSLSTAETPDAQTSNPPTSVLKGSLQHQGKTRTKSAGHYEDINLDQSIDLSAEEGKSPAHKPTSTSKPAVASKLRSKSAGHYEDIDIELDKQDRESGDREVPRTLSADSPNSHTNPAVADTPSHRHHHHQPLEPEVIIVRLNSKKSGKGPTPVLPEKPTVMSDKPTLAKKPSVPEKQVAENAQEGVENETPTSTVVKTKQSSSEKPAVARKPSLPGNPDVARRKPSVSEKPNVPRKPSLSEKPAVARKPSVSGSTSPPPSISSSAAALSAASSSSVAATVTSTSSATSSSSSSAAAAAATSSTSATREMSGSGPSVDDEPVYAKVNKKRPSQTSNSVNDERGSHYSAQSDKDNNNDKTAPGNRPSGFVGSSVNGATVKPVVTTTNGDDESGDYVSIANVGGAVHSKDT
jgi:hypothetical protein